MHIFDNLQQFSVSPMTSDNVPKFATHQHLPLHIHNLLGIAMGVSLAFNERIICQAEIGLRSYCSLPVHDQKVVQNLPFRLRRYIKIWQRTLQFDEKRAALKIFNI